MFDLIIKGGKVLDGTGNPFYRSDIGIKDGKIASIAKNLEGAKKVIDANGLTVSPGFIDSHSHSDTQILTFPDQKEKVEQGITLSVGGMCGGSIVPRPKNSDATRSVGEFMSYVKNMKLGSSVAFFIGHGNIRDAVMGTSDKDPTEKELEEMKSILREAMENGAIGMSLGLIYNPGCYSKTAEIVALAKVVAEYNGLISSHLRDEGDNLVRSVDEFLEIIRASGVRGVISHHKAMKRDNFGKISQTLRMIKEANDEGYEVYCDVYPYTASHTSLSVTVVPDSGQRLLERLKDKSEREKKHGQYLISNLIDIRKAIKKDISDLEIFIMKLHKCDSDMYNAHKNFRDSSDIIIDKLTHIGKLCDEIYELMNGVFTSCKIENVNLLIELKSNLSTYLYKIETRLDEISTGMNEFGAGIMNTDFVNTSIEKISSIKESVSQTRVSLVQDCKQLDEYIKVLNEYLEYINK
jgi:N-acyl-D-amino-acid deacylase